MQFAFYTAMHADKYDHAGCEEWLLMATSRLLHPESSQSSHYFPHLANRNTRVQRSGILCPSHKAPQHQCSGINAPFWAQTQSGETLTKTDPGGALQLLTGFPQGPSCLCPLLSCHLVGFSPSGFTGIQRSCQLSVNQRFCQLSANPRCLRELEKLL